VDLPTAPALLLADRTIVPDLRFFKNQISGLGYNFRGSPARLIVNQGSAAHYSFYVTGATVVSSTEVRAFVAANAEMSRAWNNDATWTDTNGQACLDTITASTWYYIYLVVNNNNGAADFVVTDSRTYSAVETKLASVSGGSAFSVVRRIGAFRTLAAAIDPLPFVTTTDGNSLRFNYIDHGFGFRHSTSTEVTAFAVTVLSGATSVQGLLNTSAAITANVSNFSSILIRTLPPLPGVTAEINVVHNTTKIANAVAFFAEPWASSATTVYNSVGAPTQVIKDTTTSVTSIHTRIFSVSPDANVISDTIHGGTTVWGFNSGTILRYAIANQSITMQPATETATPAFLGWDVRSFTLAR
jgi:hypothetical protein